MLRMRENIAGEHPCCDDPAWTLQPAIAIRDHHGRNSTFHAYQAWMACDFF
jgi:hypothetical protein